MSGQQYMPPQNYFEPSPAEVRVLQREAADLHDVVDSGQSSWVERTRATERLKEVERKIQTSVAAKRQAGQAQCTAPGRLILSDCGTAYLLINEHSSRLPRRVEQQQQFAPIAR